MPLLEIRVNSIGHGLGYNTYPCEFSFTMNVEENFEEDDNELDRIHARARREAQRKTACDSVSIKSVEWD